MLLPRKQLLGLSLAVALAGGALSCGSSVAPGADLPGPPRASALDFAAQTPAAVGGARHRRAVRFWAAAVAGAPGVREVRVWLDRLEQTEVVHADADSAVWEFEHREPDGRRVRAVSHAEGATMITDFYVLGPEGRRALAAQAVVSGDRSQSWVFSSTLNKGKNLWLTRLEDPRGRWAFTGEERPTEGVVFGRGSGAWYLKTIGAPAWRCWDAALQDHPCP